MKVKQLLYILLSACLALLVACTDEDNDGFIKKSDLPDSAIQFLDNFFSDTKIISVQDQSLLWESTFMGYVVKMEDEVIVSFLGDGSWVEVSAGKGLTDASKAILGTRILDQLTAAEPTAKIVSLRRQMDFFDIPTAQIYIKLDNKAEYIDTYWYNNPFGEKKYLGKVIAYEQLIEPIQTFFERHDMGHVESTAKYISHVNLSQENSDEREAYRVSFGDQVFVLDFDQKGDWLQVRAERSGDNDARRLLVKMAEKEIPQSVLESLMTVKIQGDLKQMTNYKEGVYGFLMGDRGVLVDESKGVVEKEATEGKAFVKEHFPTLELTAIDAAPIVVSPYVYYFSYRAKYKAEERTEDLVFVLNKNFRLKSLSKTNGLDVSFMETFVPETMSHYLKENYGDTVFANLMVYSHEVYSYKLNNEPAGYNLYFDQEGNFVQKESLKIQ